MRKKVRLEQGKKQKQYFYNLFFKKKPEANMTKKKKEVRLRKDEWKINRESL